MNDNQAYLQKLNNRQEKLTTKIQHVKARQKMQEHKQDTRRKILIGSYYLDQAIKNNQLNELKELMDHFLKRDSDRALFNLESTKTIIS